MALAALSSLTAPDLAFRGCDGTEGDIVEQTRALRGYLEVLAAAMVETGVLEVRFQWPLGAVKAVKAWFRC